MPEIAQVNSIRRGYEIQVVNIIRRFGIIVNEMLVVGRIVYGLFCPEFRVK
jgi:hypothetical protein